MSWSQEQIEQRVAELDQSIGWYQDIDLGNGLHTKSRVVWGETIDHPRQRWGNIVSAVPDDLSGMSVLDIGCNAGFIAFEAKKRGADYVLGVDLKEGYIEQARFCAEVTGLDVEFRQLDIYDLDQLGRRFDLVFFVGILYHCKYLRLAVEKVDQVTKTAVIVESAIDPMESEIPYVRFVRSSQYAGPKSEGSQRLPGHWHPNMTALEDLFYESGFTKINRLFKEGGRGGIVAYR
jgi:tRNA (mo5U34)-methyltransferase